MALFSNTELSENSLSEDGLRHHRGSVFGSATLIAGTTIGAGILALPLVTMPAGLLPSTILMVSSWLYMLISGLLIAEANLQVMQQTGRSQVGLLATIQNSLGKRGAIASGIVYIFIHYALLVAYVSRGGNILTTALRNLYLYFSIPRNVPPLAGHVLFVIVFGGILFWGSDRFVTRLNSLLVAVVVGSFIRLLWLTVGEVEISRWSIQHWELVSAIVPVMFVAFVYQNVVPVVTYQLEGDRQRVRWAIVLGSLVPLAMFSVWNAVILGSVDWRGGWFDGVDPTELLRGGLGQPGLGTVASIFSEVAIATSFIGFSLGLLSVLEDVFRDLIDSPTLKRTLFYALILLPPLILSALNPNIFLTAISWAGAFGNSVLFGIVPAVMVWKLQDGNKIHGTSRLTFYSTRVLLSVTIGVAVLVILQNAAIKLGVL
ncbi:MAG: aromatic amino acid transport family protein [Cyanobacteria bacterium P01_D01_bin.1]